MGFYEYIRKHYGLKAAQESKNTRIPREFQKITNIKNRKQFLLMCRDEGLVPNFINHSINVRLGNNNIIKPVKQLKFKLLQFHINEGNKAPQK